MDYDYLVIGAGSGGIASARRAAESGCKVAIAEFSTLGGTCVNRGCVPKKLMVYASRFPNLFKDAEGYGWSAVESHLDWTKMVTVVNAEVARLNGIYQRMLDNSGVTLLKGYGRFVDPHTVAIADQTVTAEKILIAVGGRPTKPNIPGMEFTITSDDIFTLPQQPKHIVILGGGYIAVEFACILRGLGSEVSVVIRKDRILRGFEDELRDMIQESMIEQGIKIFNNCTVKEITKLEQGLNIALAGASEEVLTVDTVSLCATGRSPNLAPLDLEKAGVLVEHGAIAVDADQRTSVEHIFAVGDCTDRINLTPVAIKEGRILADREFNHKPGMMEYDNIPTAIFTTPEAGTVGLTELEAKNKFGEENIKVYRAKFRAMYHTLGGRQEKTLMKLIVHTETDKVLGAHMVGESAAEIIQSVAIAVKMGATKADFDRTVALHPSAAEEFVTMR